MLEVLTAARKAELRVFYSLHHRFRLGDYETWKYIAPIQKAAWERKTFESGTWGAEIRDGFQPLPGEIVAQEHWCSSGFAKLLTQIKRGDQDAYDKVVFSRRHISSHFLMEPGRKG
jgi:nicotinamidase-related amidase